MVDSSLVDVFTAAWWIGIVLSMSFLCAVLLTSQYSWDRLLSMMIPRVWDCLPLQQPALVVKPDYPSPWSGCVPPCVPITSCCCLSCARSDADWRLSEPLMIPPWYPPPPCCSCMDHPLHALTAAEGSFLETTSHLQLGPGKRRCSEPSRPMNIVGHLCVPCGCRWQPLHLISHHRRKWLVVMLYVLLPRWWFPCFIPPPHKIMSVNHSCILMSVFDLGRDTACMRGKWLHQRGRAGVGARVGGNDPVQQGPEGAVRRVLRTPGHLLAGHCWACGWCTARAAVSGPTTRWRRRRCGRTAWRWSTWTTATWRWSSRWILTGWWVWPRPTVTMCDSSRHGQCRRTYEEGYDLKGKTVCYNNGETRDYGL